ncbi:MAG: hypothetical protein ACKPKO_05190, partial [Candidatus Fonsibacter sp.]
MRRAICNKSDGNVHITGPKYFAAAASDSSSPGVKFSLPQYYWEKTTLGMNNYWKNSKKRKVDFQS